VVGAPPRRFAVLRGVLLFSVCSLAASVFEDLAFHGGAQAFAPGAPPGRYGASLHLLAYSAVLLASFAAAAFVACGVADWRPRRGAVAWAGLLNGLLGPAIALQVTLADGPFLGGLVLSITAAGIFALTAFVLVDSA
jgi:hypothetical protein